MRDPTSVVETSAGMAGYGHSPSGVEKKRALRQLQNRDTQRLTRRSGDIKMEASVNQRVPSLTVNSIGPAASRAGKKRPRNVTASPRRSTKTRTASKGRVGERSCASKPDNGRVRKKPKGVIERESRGGSLPEIAQKVLRPGVKGRPEVGIADSGR